MAAEPKKRGRKGGRGRATRVLATIPFTPDEIEQLDLAAMSRGVSRAEYVRGVLFPAPRAQEPPAGEPA